MLEQRYPAYSPPAVLRLVQLPSGMRPSPPRGALKPETAHRPGCPSLASPSDRSLEPAADSRQNACSVAYRSRRSPGSRTLQELAADLWNAAILPPLPDIGRVEDTWRPDWNIRSSTGAPVGLLSCTFPRHPRSELGWSRTIQERCKPPSSWGGGRQPCDKQLPPPMYSRVSDTRRPGNAGLRHCCDRARESAGIPAPRPRNVRWRRRRFPSKYVPPLTAV